MPATSQFWSTCLATLESELSAHQFNTWIKPLWLDGDEEGLHVLAPNCFAIEFVKNHLLLSRIEELAKEFYGRPIAVTLVLGSAHDSSKRCVASLRFAPLPIHSPALLVSVATKTVALAGIIST
jgi:chromosomal replication initiator protein